jgi:hypothetical protein
MSFPLYLCMIFSPKAIKADQKIARRRFENHKKNRQDDKAISLKKSPRFSKSLCTLPVLPAYPSRPLSRAVMSSVLMGWIQ